MIRLIQGMAVGAVLAVALVAIALVKWDGQGDEVSASMDQQPQESEQESTLQQEWARIQSEYVPAVVAAAAPAGTGTASGSISAAAIAAHAGTTAVNPEGAAMPTPLDASEPGQSRADKVLAKLDAQFAEEAVDDAWSAQSGDQINGYVTAAAGNTEWTGSVLSDVQCHSSLCRVEVVHENEQALQEFSLQFPMLMAETLPRITYQTEPRNDGRLAMVMYLSR